MTNAELDAIREKKKDLIRVRRVIREEGEKLAAKTGYRKQVLVCGGTGCTSSHSMQVIAQLEQSLKELNINAEIQTVTSDEFYTYQFGNVLDENGIRDYDALVATWGADYPDPSANLTPLYTTENIGAGGYNCASYENPEVDRLLEESKNCASDSERMDKLFEVCDIIIEDMPYYVYNYTKVFGVISNDWDGGDTNFGSAWDWNFKNVVYNG